RILTDSHVVLDSAVQTLGVLADQHQIDVLVAIVRQQGAGRTNVRVQVELLTQGDVDRPEPRPYGRGEWPLERDSGATNRFERLFGQWCVLRLERGDPGQLALPLDGCPGRLDDPDHGLRDRGTDAVSGDECY